MLERLKQSILAVVPEVEPFFYIVPMKIVESSEVAHRFPPGTRPTAFCSPEGVFLCREFFESLPPNKQRGLLLHELFHLARGDLSDGWVDTSIPRSLFRLLSNIAQDVCIEYQVALVGRDGAPMPDRPATDSSTEHDFIRCNADYDPKYRTWGWRQVYEDLKKNLPVDAASSSDNADTTHPMQGVDVVETGSTPEFDRAIEHARAEYKQRAEARSKEKRRGVGTGSGWLDIKPEQPRIPWQTVVSEFITSTANKDERSWRRIDRRAFSRGALRRGYGSRDTLEPLTLLIDASGSMHDTLCTVAGDILSLIRLCAPPQLNVVYYDVGVLSRTSYDVDDLYTAQILSMPSGGGTDVRAVLRQLINDHDYEPHPMIALTDGCDDYDIPLDISQRLGPMIWVSYDTPVQSNYGSSVVVN